MTLIKRIARKIPGARPAFYAFKRWRARALSQLSPQEVFRGIYRENRWGAEESVSGTGSTDEQTRRVRIALPELLRRLDVRTLLDVPCGDFHWMRHVDLGDIRYIGGDIVPELIERNRVFEKPGRTFRVIDLCADELPPADAILVRDCLVHLCFNDIARALANIRRSPATYLITTTYPNTKKNYDIVTGQWRRLNLEAPPFSFPPPLHALVEGSTEAGGDVADKTLAVWRIADIPEPRF